MAEKKTTNVNVCVRCRPLNDSEKKSGAGGTVKCDTAGATVTLTTGKGEKKTSKEFQFDRVFGAYSTQEEVFNTTVRPIVDEVLEGYNSTLFAFGPTGTGKTHTMEGEIMDDAMAGIVPRAVRLILEKLDASKAEYTVRVSFLELYNEELQDLLVEPGDKSNKPLRLCEDINKGVVCQNLEEVSVMNADHIFDILKKGIKQRQTAATLCNKNSSRSHSIFTLKIMIKETAVTGEDVVRHGQLNLVDLAGSECVGRSGVKGEQKREAGSINQSLLTLGRVITALVDHHGHIPYRDSKLTRLLQESLGGKAKTCIIATLSPSHLAYEETMSTLDYAFRARAIKNVPQVNQRMGKRVVMKEFAQEIEQLRVQLQMTREKNGIFLAPEEFERMENKMEAQEAQLAECEAALRSREEEMKTIRSEREDMAARMEIVESELASTCAKLESAETKVVSLTVEVADTKMDLAASEAVVGEQVSTEKGLTHTGAVLADEATQRRRDVDSLLVKVDMLTRSEAERGAAAAEYAALVRQQQLDTCVKLEEMMSFSAHKTTEMSAGVDELLLKGRSTCTALDGSIQAALSTLTSGVTDANGAIVAACGDVQSKLASADTMVVDSLQAIKTDLSGWLGEVDANMAAAKSHLEGQMSSLTALTSAMAEQYKANMDVHSQLAQRADSASAAASVQLDELKTSIAVELAAHTTSQQDLVALAQADMAKAKGLGEALMALATANADRLTAMSGIMATATTGIVGVADAGAARVADALASQVADIKTGLGALGVVGKSVLENNDRSLAHITTHNNATATVLATVGSTVGHKRKHLDDSVSHIVQDVHGTITSSTTQVAGMEVAANVMLSDVARCSEDMTASTKVATGDFVEFIDAHGQKLVGTVADAGSAISAHLAVQTEVQQAGGVHNDAFASTMTNTAVQARGSTPKKTVFGQLPGLATTRQHSAIKSEVRAGIYQAPTSPACALITSTKVTAAASEETTPFGADEQDQSVSEIEVEMELTSDEAPVTIDTCSSAETAEISPVATAAVAATEKASASPVPTVRASLMPAKKAAPAKAAVTKRVSKLTGPRKRTSSSSENTDPQTKSPRVGGRTSRRSETSTN